LHGLDETAGIGSRQLVVKVVLSLGIGYGCDLLPDRGSTLSQPQQPEMQGPVIAMPPEIFEGKWANMAMLQRSPHEFTLDFVRLGPQGQQGIVVARISFSDVLLGDLVEIFNAHWEVYTQEAGIPPQMGLTPDDEGGHN
jgi:Protein of unknown function (DUF3467)